MSRNDKPRKSYAGERFRLPYKQRRLPEGQSATDRMQRELLLRVPETLVLASTKAYHGSRCDRCRRFPCEKLAATAQQEATRSLKYCVYSSNAFDPVETPLSVPCSIPFPETATAEETQWPS